MDRAREGLFNILVHRFDIENKKCLDLFAGAGGVCYELLSRGAASVLAVDKDRKCVSFIASVLEKLGAENGEVMREDVLRFIPNYGEHFDLIFADPPYAMSGQEAMVVQILEHLLLPGGMFILEHDSRITFDHLPGFLESREYGKGAFSFFILPESSEENNKPVEENPD